MKSLKFLLAIPLGFLLLGSIGCDPIKSDIVDYSKTAIPVVNKFSADISKKLEEGQAVSSKKAYVDLTRKELIPLLKDFQEKLGATKPATKELQEIHEAYLASIKEMGEGFGDIVKAIDKQDQALAKSAQVKIEGSAKGEEKYRNDFNELAKKHGVKFKD